MSHRRDDGRDNYPTRFSKGQSGNPKGRPHKRVPTASAFDVLIEKTLTITQSGRAREVTVDEALQHKTYLEALSGSRPARREVLKMIAKREQALAARTPPQRRVEVRTRYCDSGNANAALLLLGVAMIDIERSSDRSNGEQHLLLQPWAVELALRRRRRPLTKRNLEEIRRCTSEPETVTWPKAGSE